ncbi:CHAP domain-containing protein [Chamaesiphon sp. GL140_3_metabinner_50]|uniref:CHAP domain-containing protein n=1 Tax=Chamaesiphon sp. GL140_3_metabinner_50 TaxID=2970812 RepID=UPI0025EBC76B|nr:CHAP domain-containing protein [Chamaesiphon sp. GL140_3_metabinner_50]
MLYRQSNGQALWNTATYGRNVKQTIFQTDGNLVIYNTSNQPVWASNTDRRGGTQLIVQDDGNVVIYSSQNRPIWATNTNGIPCNVPSQRDSQRKVNAFANDWLTKRVWRKDNRNLDGECVTLIARYLQDHYGKGALWIGDGRNTAGSVGSQFPNEFLPLSDPRLPIPGSIMSFSATSSNPFGHVVLVRSVQQNGNNLTLTILESNFAYPTQQDVQRSSSFKMMAM